MRLGTQSVTTNFIVALRSEAQAIIDHYAMRPTARHGAIRTYACATARLAITGIGRTNAATAVGYLGAQSSESTNVWLNIGIAGHQNAEVGQCFLVDKLFDQDTGISAYPSISFVSRLSSCALRTVSNPETQYPHPSLYDMEGAAFFNAATQFSPPELISLLKIVSDNQHHPVEKIDRDFVVRLMSDALEQIVELASTLEQLAKDQFEIVDYSTLQASITWHTTESQKYKINNLCRRLCSLDPAIDLGAIMDQCGNARNAIATLQENLDRCRFSLEES